MTLELDWEIKALSDHRGVNIVRTVIAKCFEITKETFPDLLEMMPINHHVRFNEYFSPSGWLILRIVFDPQQSIMMGGYMPDEVKNDAVSKIEPYVYREPDNLNSLLGSEWIASDRFTYVGPYEENKVSWINIYEHIVVWLRDYMLPDVLQRNAIRVSRAIPTAPTYDYNSLSQAIWVLECEDTNFQGSAFALNDVGFVTCSHAIGTATNAFRWDKPKERYPIKVKKRNADIDLAIFEIDADNVKYLSACSSDDLKIMDHLLVCGFPNHRLSDTPKFMPGNVVGFTTRSAIRRILTNAAIVTGASGGAVVNSMGEVIGIAVTGAENVSATKKTEDLGIIPIEALNYL